MQRSTIASLAITLITSMREKVRWPFPSVLLALLCCTLSAQAQVDVGTSTLIFDYEVAYYGDHSAGNVAMVIAAGQRWYAVEWFDVTNMMPALDLFWDDNVTITRTPTPLLLSGELVQNLMYPGLVTWGAHPYVYVAGKVDTANGPQLTFFRQDRTNLSANPSQTALGNAPPMGTEHSRPHLAFDEDMGSGLGTNQMYVCWTAKNTGEEDVKSKAKDPSIGWRQAPLHDIAVGAGVIEDHCEQSFNHLGNRYTVYHSKPNMGMHGTWVHVDRWDSMALTTTEIATFELLDAAHVMGVPTNFPSTATSADASNTYHLVVAKREMQAPPLELSSWICDAAMAGDCEVPGDWSYIQQSLRGSVFAPKAVVHNGDRYVLYEDRSGTPVLRLYKMCLGGGTWTEVGEIPPPDANHTTGAREFNANLPSTAVSTFTVDRDNIGLHAIFVAQKDGTNLYNPAHWKLDISGGCAGL